VLDELVSERFRKLGLYFIVCTLLHDRYWPDNHIFPEWYCLADIMNVYCSKPSELPWCGDSMGYRAVVPFNFC
jgi:hypothetical protein